MPVYTGVWRRAAIDLALVLQKKGDKARADIKADMATHMEQIREMEARGEIGQVPGVKFDPN